MCPYNDSCESARCCPILKSDAPGKSVVTSIDPSPNIFITSTGDDMYIPAEASKSMPFEGSIKLGTDSDKRRGYRDDAGPETDAGENVFCDTGCGLVAVSVGSTKNSEGEKASGLLWCDPPSLPAPLAATLGVFFRMGLIQGGRELDCS